MGICTHYEFTQEEGAATDDSAKCRPVRLLDHPDRDKAYERQKSLTIKQVKERMGTTCEMDMDGEGFSTCME